jgi:hypothetical protein
MAGWQPNQRKDAAGGQALLDRHSLGAHLLGGISGSISGVLASSLSSTLENQTQLSLASTPPEFKARLDAADHASGHHRHAWVVETHPRSL